MSISQAPFPFFALKNFRGPVLWNIILGGEILGFFLGGRRIKKNFLSDLLVFCQNHQIRAQSLKVYQLLTCLILIDEWTVFRCIALC